MDITDHYMNNGAEAIHIIEHPIAPQVRERHEGSGFFLTLNSYSAVGMESYALRREMDVAGYAGRHNPYTA